jgi:hypothetical protein
MNARDLSIWQTVFPEKEFVETICLSCFGAVFLVFLFSVA